MTTDYDQLCNEIDILTIGVCDFQDGKCKYCRDNNLKENSCCPDSCKQLTPIGCNTKNIMCKLAFACDCAEHLNKEIDIVREKVKQSGYYGKHFFKSSEQITIQ